MKNSMDLRGFLKASLAGGGLILAISLSGFPSILARGAKTRG